MSAEENQTIICKPMQTLRLSIRNFTKSFVIYKSIYIRCLQKWNAMLKCRWIRETLQPKKSKSKSKVEKKKPRLAKLETSKKQKNKNKNKTKLLNKKKF